MASEDELLAKLESWLSEQSDPPTIFDAVDTGDGEILAGFILKGFRAAARRAVLQGLLREENGANNADQSTVSGAIFSLVDRIAERWELTRDEEVTLLGLSDVSELEALRVVRLAELPIRVIERIAILLDIFKAINILLPRSSTADAWLREPNSAALFGGRTALALMLEGGLDGLRSVRAYLQAEIWAR